MLIYSSQFVDFDQSQTGSAILHTTTNIGDNVKSLSIFFSSFYFLDYGWIRPSCSIRDGSHRARKNTFRHRKELISFIELVRIRNFLREGSRWHFFKLIKYGFAFNPFRTTLFSIPSILQIIFPKIYFKKNYEPQKLFQVGFVKILFWLKISFVLDVPKVLRDGD